MTTNYDEFVDDYGKTESSLFRMYIEKSTILSVLEDVQAKSVLDLACGPGNYTRTVKTQGAANVIGVDISEKMIARARLLEEIQPLGIEYRVRDVRELEQIGLFDIVTAIYLFPYAQMEQDLEDMVQATYNNLKPNGRLVALTINPDITKKHYTAAEKFHIYIYADDSLQDGTPFKVILSNPGQEDDIHLLPYYWSKETYEKILKKAGFQKIKWYPMIVAEEGIEKYGESYWQEYLAVPHIIVLESYK